MAGNYSLHGLESEQDEALALSEKDHGKCTNGSVDIAQDDVPRKFQLKDANKFAKILKHAYKVFVGFIEAVNMTGEYHFTYRTAYSDTLEMVVNKESKALFNEIQVCYPDTFMELKYPITQKRVPFNIPLIDEKLPPPKRKLYPLSEPELKEFREQLKVLVDSSRIVPLASPYRALILFAAKKGGSGLQMCMDYYSLNSNTVIDSFPLPRIGELLAHLHGSKVFLKLDLYDGYYQIPIIQED